MYKLPVIPLAYRSIYRLDFPFFKFLIQLPERLISITFESTASMTTR